MSILTTIQKRARRKFLTYAFIIRLAELNSPLKKSYWNTYHCCKNVWHNKEVSDRYLSKYCKNRWCLVCASIRTAVLINAYQPILEQWKDKCLLTLTVKTCSVEILRSTTKEMNKAFYDGVRLDRALCKKNRLDIKCVKKIEVTYNTKSGEYHPHFHIITETTEQAEYLLEYWMKYWLENYGEGKAKRVAQDIVPADEGSMVELFKYFTKIITENTEKSVKKKITPPENLNEIFCAIKGMHTVQPFGFKVSLPDDPDDIEFDVEKIELAEKEFITVFGWDQDSSDWVSKDTGEMLSGYEPSAKFEAFVKQLEKQKGSNSYPV